MDYKKIFSQLRTGDLNLRPSSLDGRQGLGEALFGEGYWFQKINQEAAIEDQTLTSVDTPPNTEKESTLNSLEEFVVKKTEQKVEEEKKVSFRGGEIKLRSGDEALSILKLNYNPEEGILPTSLTKNHEPLHYLFLGDNFLSKENVSPQEDLLDKMISAMKLNPSEYLRLPFENTDEESEEFKQFVNLVAVRCPLMIISLGAVSTNILLGQKERLSRVHGKIFERTLQFKNKSQSTINIMPIFHPDYLKINPNMKRAAWTDLQKAMEQLSRL